MTVMIFLASLDVRGGKVVLIDRAHLRAESESVDESSKTILLMCGAQVDE